MLFPGAINVQSLQCSKIQVGLCVKVEKAARARQIVPTWAEEVEEIEFNAFSGGLGGASGRFINKAPNPATEPALASTTKAANDAKAAAQVCSPTLNVRLDRVILMLVSHLAVVARPLRTPRLPTTPRLLRRCAVQLLMFVLIALF